MPDRGQWEGRKLHFVGIGGAGMGPLARLAIELGATVSGSDRADQPSLAALDALGATVSVGHDESHLPEGAQVVYSTAVTPDNPERSAARAAGGHELHRSDLLAEMTSMRRTIAVTGTHGKTTTTAMVLAALRGAGRSPGWMVGAELASGEPASGWGDDEWFVIEADESDRSLLKFDTEIALLTNCELDHHATYSSLEKLEETFSRFLGSASQAVVWDQPRLTALVPEGVPVSEYSLPDVRNTGRGTVFHWHGIEVELAVPGSHNALNACGALEAALIACGDPEGVVAGIGSFTGTGRRFEHVGETSGGARLIDDYAHHPTEVRATLEAARSVTDGRVIAVFQPHLYSRTKAFELEFGEALAGADHAVVLDIYPAREQAEDFPGVSSAGIATAAARRIGEESVSLPGGLDRASDLLRELLRPGDLCLLMGAGDVGELARELMR